MDIKSVYKKMIEDSQSVKLKEEITLDYDALSQQYNQLLKQTTNITNAMKKVFTGDPALQTTLKSKALDSGAKRGLKRIGLTAGALAGAGLAGYGLYKLGQTGVNSDALSGVSNLIPKIGDKEENEEASNTTPQQVEPKEKEITDELINEIWQNKHGKGEARKQKLRSMGYTEAQLDEIQRRVNAKDYRGSPKKVTQGVIDAVNRGEYGSGQARIQNLRGDGYTDAQIEYIQSVINNQAKATQIQTQSQQVEQPSQLSNDQILVKNNIDNPDVKSYVKTANTGEVIYNSKGAAKTKFLAGDEAKAAAKASQFLKENPNVMSMSIDDRINAFANSYHSNGIIKKDANGKPTRGKNNGYKLGFFKADDFQAAIQVLKNGN